MMLVQVTFIGGLRGVFVQVADCDAYKHLLQGVEYSLPRSENL